MKLFLSLLIVTFISSNSFAAIKDSKAENETQFTTDNLYFKATIGMNYGQKAKSKANSYQTSIRGAAEQNNNPPPFVLSFIEDDPQPNGFPNVLSERKNMNYEAKNSLKFAGGFGYEILNNLRTEVMINFLRTKTYKNASDSGKASFSIFNPMINAHLDIGKFRNITPFLSAGIGVARIKSTNLMHTAQFDRKTHIIPLPSDAILYYADNISKYNLSWMIGAGLAFNLSDSIIAEISYSYTDYGKVKQLQSDSSNETYDAINPNHVFVICSKTFFNDGNISTRLVNNSINLGLRFKL